MSENIGAMVELDYCVGCYACQSACQNSNGLPVKETYLRCDIMKPEKVRGELHYFMCPIPYDLGACAACIEREGGEAPCAKICIGHALHIGPAGQVEQLAKSCGGRKALFF